MQHINLPATVSVVVSSTPEPGVAVESSPAAVWDNYNTVQSWVEHA